MAFKSYEKQSRETSWGSDEDSLSLDQLQYGAAARIATALEGLNHILRAESNWCEIRANIRKLANSTHRVKVRYELSINIRWPWSKKRKR